MRTTMFLRVVLLVGGLGLAATACGDDGGSTSEPVDTTPTDDGTADTTPAPDDEAPPDDGSDLEFEDDRSAELIGTWTITTYQLPGALGEADTIEAPTITFADDGTVSFDTGCNTGGGDYETAFAYLEPEDDALVVGQGISIGSLSLTEIGCEGPLADQDLGIPGAIRAADLFQFIDGDLVLWRDGNVMIAANPAT